MTVGRSRRWLFVALFLLAVSLVTPTCRAQTPAAPPLVPPAPDTAGPATLPPVFAPSPIPLGDGLLVGGALDLRTRTSTSGRQGVWVNSAELDLQQPISSHGQPRGNIVIQLMAEDPPDVRHAAADVQIGEAYFLYQLPIHTDTGTTAFVKLGQFQIPFALLAVYDPHLQILQPLYAQSLGLRTDWGVALTGHLYGYLQYDLSLTTGTGPNHADVDPNRLVTFRLGRTFTTRNGEVTFGGSLLSGRLPVTDLDANNPFALELPPSGRVRADRFDSEGNRFTPKTRIAGDATYAYRSLSARAEAMVGADKDKRVQGYYAEGDYRFTPRATLTAAHSTFIYPVGDSSSTGNSVGLSYAFGRELTLSSLYQYLRDVPRDSGGQVRQQLTLQVLLRF